MDSFVSMTWYDLPAETGDDYLSWLHGEALPALAAQPGCAWAAHYKNIGTEEMRRLHDQRRAPDGTEGAGAQYAVIAGWTSLETLLQGRSLEALEEAHGRSGQRQSPQTAVFATVITVDGMAGWSRARGGTPAPAIQTGMLRLKSVAAEMQIARWYIHNRFPLIGRTPGAVGARVMACVAGWPKFAVLYEFDSVQSRAAGFEPMELEEEKNLRAHAANNPIPLDDLLHVPGSPFVGERLWPAVGPSA